MVKKWNVTIPALSGDAPRQAYISLPASYDKCPDARYPVLYLFDGQNIFFDRDATFGKSWGMDAYLRKSRRELIVVAVECNREGNRRLAEYSPFSCQISHYGAIEGQGDAYLNWMITNLKPYIDRSYRTFPDREHTAVGGSSMGGLMALYGVSAYNSVFQKAVCLSPSLWIAPDKVTNMVKNTKYARDTAVYLDYGEKEMFSHAANPEILLTTAQNLLKKRVNLTFRIVPGGSHCEASWEKQVPIFMDCLEL